MNKRIISIATCISIAIFYIAANSFSSGISGVSSAGCSCHGPSSNATVLTLQGLPTTYTSGQTYPLTLLVSNSTKQGAGFNLSVNQGSISNLGADMQAISATEITHTSPSPIATSGPFSGAATFTFNWTAPISGNVVFNIAGNAVNLDGGTSGDQWKTAVVNLSQAVAPLSLTSNKTNINCNGGTATITNNASGGTPPYQHRLNTGTFQTASTFTNVIAGTYTMTVRDATLATATSVVNITQPNAILSNILSNTSVLCFGGTNGAITASFTGGTPPLSYNWTPGNPTGDGTLSVSNLTSGTWTVTATDGNGCTKSQTAVVTSPTALAASISSFTNPSCNGGSNGSLSVNVSGGTPGYTYNWLPSGGLGASASGLSAGTYTCVITDANGCTVTTTKQLIAPAVLNATISSFANVVCASDGSASINVIGGTAPYTYSWLPSGGTGASASNLSGGTYTCTVTDVNTCSTTISVIISHALTAPTANISSVTNLSCFGISNGSATTNAINGTGPYTYSWLPSGGTAATASGLAAGNYTCIVTDVNGCTSLSNVAITSPTVLNGSINNFTNITCNGSANGLASMSVTGGTSPYTYIWSPSGGSNAVATGLMAGSYSCIAIDANGCSTIATKVLTQPTLLLANAGAQTNISCNGNNTGTATVNASGGVAPYTYSWTPSGGTAATATSLGAGNYTCTITDVTACTASISFTITQPLLSVSANISSISHISCFGLLNGTASVNAVGGTAPYNYNWIPSGGTNATALGLAAGNYTCIVTDANGCSAVTNVAITSPSALNGAINNFTNITCNGSANGLASMSVTGGTSPYTYIWSPSGGSNAVATGLMAGSYSCIAIDANGCSVIATKVLTQPTLLQANAGAQTNISCNGNNTGTGTATVNASGGVAPYTYSWTPSGGTAATATGLSAGNYTCTITDATACTASISFTITQPLLSVSANISSISHISCFGLLNGVASVNAVGGTAPYNYNWIPSGGTNATALGLAAGNYTCIVTDANGCSAVTNVAITSPSALNGAINNFTNITCNGSANGLASMSVTGGTSPYTYIWSPSGGSNAVATGLVAGSYSCIAIDANGCSTIATKVLTQPTILNLSASSLNGISNGAISFSASGGLSPYQYSVNGITQTSPQTVAFGSYTILVTDANGCTASTTLTVSQTTSNPLQFLQAGSNSLICANSTNGIINTSTNYNSGVTYIIQPGGTTNTSGIFSGLTAGTYTVNASSVSNGNTTTIVIIQSPSPLNLNANVTTGISCAGNNNGKITATTTGGTPNYSYLSTPALALISPTIFGNAAASTYTIKVTDAAGCTATTSIVLTQPTPIGLNPIQFTSPSCNGASNGTMNVSANNGTTPYIFSLNPLVGLQPTPGLFVNLNSRIYQVKVVDANGCSKTTVVLMAQPSAVRFTNVTKTNLKCNGDNSGIISAITTGGSGAKMLSITPSGSILNNTSFNNLGAGSFTLTATDANTCTKTTTIVLSQPSPITWSNVLVTGANANNGSIVVSAVGGVGTKSYFLNNATTSNNSGTFGGLAAGIYTITAKDIVNCNKTTVATVNLIALPINSKDNEFSSFTLYPNPTSNHIFIKGELSVAITAEIIIYDRKGNIVKKYKENLNKGGQEIKLELSSLSSGQYILRMFTDGNLIQTINFEKR